MRHMHRVREKWKTSLDKGKNIGAIVIDLSPALDFVKHGLLLTILYA